MRIGITINNILRNHIDKLSEAYTALTLKEPILPINPYDLYASFPKEDDEELNIVDFDMENQSDGLSNDKDLDMAGNDISFDPYEFMYIDGSFEIFGRCEQAEDNIISKLTSLKADDVEVVLLNKETARSKCATLFFLSKTNFDLNALIFPDNFNDFTNHCDVIVTDNPKILENPNPNKIIIKVQNDFNVDYKADFTIFKISELPNIINEVKGMYQNKTNI